MTDVELLPLPKYPVDGAGDEDSYNTGWNDCLAECRANVAHATAAKDAEIEALRAEVRELKRANDQLGDHGTKLYARAERLAEALRGALDAVRDTLQSSYNSAGQECCGRSGFECCGAPVLVWAPEDQAVMDKLAPIERLLSSALHPTAAQEMGRG